MSNTPLTDTIVTALEDLKAKDVSLFDDSVFQTLQEGVFQILQT